jgi:formylglycine-generating enzyme required for sulfatase activity
VGSYWPNAFGLHDMVGNVSEWVADCGDKSSTQFSDESGYPTGSCKSRVDRGGSWSSYECCIGYASNHDYIWPNLSKSSDLQRGFRLAQDI